MADWDPDHKESVEFNDNGFKGSRTVYLFIVPAKVEGKWTLADGTRSIELNVKQAFQRFSGTATVGGKTAAIKDGKLNGAAIEFTLDIDGKPVKYEGKVDGNAITGTNNWTAKKAS
jgi:hypothetical protein